MSGPRSGPRLSTGALFIIVVLVALLGVSIWMAVDVWTSTDRAAAQADGQGEVSGHGIIALILGGIGSVIVGGGLMALVFFSNRSGHDQTVHDEYKSRVHPDDDPLR
ncbi:hypothetical protein [Indioceanicola profundi]|uniref:hypothetical protein n=1 Tax=Indioceanicola profundi TaxID=2220096 RepID=UPI000E6ADD11|nr:hypothetical protein [Indioceanicola profundi]